MPFHTAAWWQSVNPAGVFVSLTPVPDPILTVLSPNIQVPILDRVVALAGGVETTAAQQARLTAPSRRILVLQRVSPLQGNAAAGSLPADPHHMVDHRLDPLPMVRGEQMTFDIVSTPAAVQAQWGIIWLADKEIPSINGPIFTARATGATALVIGLWTNMAIAFAEALPRGRYQVVGFRAQSPNMVASRLVFVGGVQGAAWRPGVLATNTDRHLETPMFRWGNFGVFGEFEDTDPPTVDCLGNVADAAQVFYFDLIQVRAGPG